MLVVQCRMFLHNLVGFFGHRLVQVFARLVILIDGIRLVHCNREFLLRQQVHSLFAILNTPRGIDARANFEHNIPHGKFLVVQSAHINDSFQSHTWIAVDLLQPVVSQNAIFAHDRYYIARNAHSTEVKQRNQVVEIYAITDSKSLHKLKAHTTPRQVLVWVRVIPALGVQDGHGRWKFIVWHMVVADDEIYTFLFCIGYFLYGLDAAVKHDDKLHARLFGIVHSLERNAIALFISIRDVVIDIRVKLLNKLVNQRYCRSAVYVIISIDEDTLLTAHGCIQPIDRKVHVPHQKWIEQVRQLGTEEFLRLGHCRNTTLYQ